ncbi:sugar porter family MFS transporter [Rhodovibrionaceae bacterium A322]
MAGGTPQKGLPGMIYRVSYLTLCCGLLFGYSTASIAGWLDSIAKEFSLGIAAQEYFTVSLVICCFFGAVVAGPLNRKFGRKVTLALAFVLAVAGYGLTLLHPPLAWVIVARFLIGLSVGISSMTAPMFAGEATPARYRGGVVSLFQLAVTLGIMIAYAVPLWLEDPALWARAIGGGGLIAIAGAVGLLLVPESPTWLIAVGEKAAGLKSAAKLGFEPDAFSGDQADQSDGPQGFQVLRQFLTQGTTMAVIWLCCGLFILQNLSGIDGILYYAPTIFIELGFEPGVAALGATFGLGVVNVIATVVAILTVDRLGRRPLALYGALAMVLGLVCVVLAQIWDWSGLGLAGLCIYIAAFAMSLGPLPYVMMAELIPSTIRETGLAVASATSWLFNALVAFFFLSGVSVFGLAAVFVFFALVCGLAFIISLVWMPETKGRNLEAIEERVLAGQPLRRVGEVSDETS